MTMSRTIRSGLIIGGKLKSTIGDASNDVTVPTIDDAKAIENGSNKTLVL